MYLSPEAQRLLEEVRRAHEALLAHFSTGDRAGDAHRRGFRAVYEALESALGDVDDDHLRAAVNAGERTPAEVLVHIAEHDQRIEEAERRGVEHMIEHGLDHARALWLARSPDGAVPPHMQRAGSSSAAHDG